MSDSSVCKQVIDRMIAALVGVTDAGDRVYDSREAALARDETPCIAIMPPDVEDTKVFGGGVDENTMLVTVEVLVRNDAWRAAADRIAIAVHRILMRDADLQAMVVDMRKRGRKWEAEEADQTAGSDATTYRLIYLSPSDDATATI